jgi:hypothetical protein
MTGQWLLIDHIGQHLADMMYLLNNLGLKAHALAGCHDGGLLA